MADLKKSEIKIIEKAMAFPMGFGYVLDFSNQTMADFFEEEFGINIYDECYIVDGSSKRNCLITFLKLAEPSVATKLLVRLYERRMKLVERCNSLSAVYEANEVTPDFKKVIDDIRARITSP